MTGSATKDAALQALGAFFCAFSEVEHELGKAMGAVIRVEDPEATKFLVAALGDISKKLSLLLAAVQSAKKADGSDASEQWKQEAIASLKAVFKCNEDRVLLAHSRLQCTTDGLMLTRQKLDRGVFKSAEETWDTTKLKGKIDRLEELTKKVRKMGADLNTLVISIPDDIWITIEPSSGAFTTPNLERREE
jgi:hypothetical protein